MFISYCFIRYTYCIYFVFLIDLKINYNYIICHYESKVHGIYFMSKSMKATLYNNINHFALAVKIMITNYFHFDKKQSLEFDIQANKLISIKPQDYYDLDHVHTHTC